MKTLLRWSNGRWLEFRARADRLHALESDMQLRSHSGVSFSATGRHFVSSDAMKPATSSGARPAGPRRAVQPTASNFGMPRSASVAASGSIAVRFSVATASAL